MKGGEDLKETMNNNFESKLEKTQNISFVCFGKQHFQNKHTIAHSPRNLLPQESG